MGEKLRVLTLTSPSSHPRTPSGGKLLATRWQTLRKSIGRKFGYRLEYCRVRTDEGYGVLHVIYRAGKKGFIPHKWLKREWKRIHGASIVFIQALRGKNKRIARYISANYISGHHSFMRQSWSWNWCFRGFVRTWYRIRSRSASLSETLVRWNLILRQREPQLFYKENRKKKWWKDLGHTVTLDGFM